MAPNEKNPTHNDQKVRELEEKKLQIITQIQKLRLELTKVSDDMRKAGGRPEMIAMCF